MKPTSYLFLTLSICLCCFGCKTQQCSRETCLDLDGGFWSFYSADPNAQMQDVWRVEDGVLICSGSPLGYLYSNEQFDNFVMKLEWRWPPDGEPGKGGVLLRMTGEHKIWPKSLEAQINAGGAGDFWGLDGYELLGPPDRTSSLDHQQFGKLTNVKKAQAVEKPSGQWNTYEIIADGDTVTLIINGTEINKATRCATNKGPILLTSEGTEIHFRNIEVVPLAGTPKYRTVITSENFGRIAGMQWILQKMTVAGKEQEILGERPFIKFEKNGGVGGFASVNRFFGSMEIDDKGIAKWGGPFGVTRMAGPPDAMKQESDFLNALQQTSRLSTEKIYLYIQTPDGQTELVFYVPVE